MTSLARGSAGERLRAAPLAYFEAVDRKDLDAALGFFAEDATFTVQTAGLHLAGRDAIAGMFRAFFAAYRTICHDVTNLVVDETAARAATEQRCPHVRSDGAPEPVTACNTFAFGPDGRFSRVVVWIDAPSPLR